MRPLICLMLAISVMVGGCMLPIYLAIAYTPIWLLLGVFPPYWWLVYGLFVTSWLAGILE